MEEALEVCFHHWITTSADVRVRVVPSVLSSMRWFRDWGPRSVVREWVSVLVDGVGSHQLQGVWAAEASAGLRFWTSFVEMDWAAGGISARALGLSP